MIDLTLEDFTVVSAPVDKECYSVVVLLCEGQMIPLEQKRTSNASLYIQRHVFIVVDAYWAEWTVVESRLLVDLDYQIEQIIIVGIKVMVIEVT